MKGIEDIFINFKGLLTLILSIGYSRSMDRDLSGLFIQREFGAEFRYDTPISTPPPTSNLPALFETGGSESYY